MATFRVRAVRPVEWGWSTVEADSPEDAAAEYQEVHDPPFCGWRVPRGNGHEHLRLVAVEVEGHGDFIARQFRSGIFRGGGVHRPSQTLSDIATQLGWARPPEELIADGWPGEEQYPAP